jgi:hypothetical protein
MGVFAALGGAHALLFQDRRYRLVAWLTLLAIAAGWTTYFVAWREPAMRITLEVASVAALVAGGFRVRWLIKSQGRTPPLYSAMARATRGTWSVLRWPWILSAKVWLAAMLVMQWRGKAHFSVIEYATVTAVILALITIRVVALMRARSRFATLAQPAADATTGG